MVGFVFVCLLVSLSGKSSHESHGIYLQRTTIFCLIETALARDNIEWEERLTSYNTPGQTFLAYLSPVLGFHRESLILYHLF